MHTGLRWFAIGIAALVVLTVAGVAVLGPDAIARTLLDGHQAFVQWIAANKVLGAVVFVAVAAAGMLTPIPSATLILMVAGVAFGPLGGLLTAVGMSLSAALALLIGRRLLARPLERHLGARLAPLRQAVGARPFHALLTLRLLPGFPAWLSNLVPLPLPMPLPKVMLATFLGVLPICLTFSSIGSALGSITAVDGLSAASLLNAETLLPLVALFVLSAASLIVRRRLDRRAPALPLPVPPEQPRGL